MDRVIRMEGHALKSREDRWREEADFFNRAAERIDTKALPLDPVALQRYTRPVLRSRFNKEYRFKVLGPVAGKVLLDVGCGDGQNSVMLALMGAQVTGIDVSPGAIALARRRAEVNGVSDRVRFLCAPVERADLPERSFDIVWGEGILHHVLDDLDLVLRHLARCAKREGLLIFSEPINLSPMLRRIRQSVPIRTDATPGERPMLKNELDLVRRHVPDLVMRPYSLLGRLDRLILIRYNYERSPVVRRGIVNGMAALDRFLMLLPGFKRLASTCVLHGHPAQSDS
jgi:2-polyprenyl-3-methyl-5-hydroxy-6-metoxy-1,4-benzoquinol methylase